MYFIFQDLETRRRIVEKVFSSLHKITVKSLMADGLFWQCLLFGSQRDSHKPLEFHPKYIQLCSEDERIFYGFETTWGKWFLTQFLFWGGVIL